MIGQWARLALVDQTLFGAHFPAGWAGRRWSPGRGQGRGHGLRLLQGRGREERKEEEEQQSIPYSIEYFASPA